MNVSAILVTRGNVDLAPIEASIPTEWELVVWDNGRRVVRTWAAGRREGFAYAAEDVSVYGRYAAIEHASGDVIYVQDDDAIVSDPAAIVSALVVNHGMLVTEPLQPLDVTHVQIDEDLVVCNMPPEFRHDFYTDHALVGFGAAFHRDAPERAFERWWNHDFKTMRGEDGFFNRTCDIVFTGLTPRVLVEVPYESLEYATGPDRMYRQPTHVAERMRMRELVREVARER